MTETTTPSVEGDRLEAIARLIDPDAYELVYLMGEEPFLLGPWEGRRQAALAKARQIDALPCKGGEGAVGFPTSEQNQPLAERSYAFVKMVGRLDHTGDDGFTLPEDDLDDRHALDGLIAQARDIMAATPTTEPDTGRGLRADVENEARRLYIAHVDGAGIHCNRFPSWGEMSDDSKARWRDQALAALSDTPRGRLEKDLGASRDLRSDADAACLADAKTLVTWLLLGRPEPSMGLLAFPDMHPDDVLFRNSGDAVTVGDVRVLQEALISSGLRAETRCETVLSDVSPKGCA